MSVETLYVRNNVNCGREIRDNWEKAMRKDTAFVLLQNNVRLLLRISIAFFRIIYILYFFSYFEVLVVGQIALK